MSRADISDKLVHFHGPYDKFRTMRNIHRWAFFFIAIGIALWMSGVSPQLGIIIFVIGLVGLVIAWVIRWFAIRCYTANPQWLPFSCHILMDSGLLLARF